MEFITAIATHRFLQYALLAGLLASVGCGVMGTCVVVRRIGFLAGGIAHAVLGGLGFALYVGIAPLLGAVIAALLAALIIGWVSLRRGENEDVLVSAVWSIGMAAGVLFIAKTPGYSTDLMNYMFGNVLLVEPRALRLMAILDCVLIAVVICAYKPLLAIMFDEEFARLRGVATTAYFLLLLCLVALTVVLLLPVVGLILVLALLTLPAAIASQFAKSLGAIMVVASLLGFVFTTAGLALSYGPDLPPGATIVMIAGCSYLASVGIADWRRRRRMALHA